MAIDLPPLSDEETKKFQPFQAAPVQQDFSPAVPTLGTGLQGMSRVISDSGVAAPNPDTGFVTGSVPGEMPKPIAGPGRDASGIITADSAPRAYGNDMQRSGGVFGGIDMAGVNGIMARENKARGEMIDLSIAANGGNGINILGDGGIEAANAEKTARWRQDDLLSKVKNSPVLASVAQGVVAGNNQLAAEGMRSTAHYATEIARQGITARGQDLNAMSDANRNAVTMRGQDIGANTDAVRLGIDQQRLGIQQQDANRSGDKWALDKTILQGQAADAETVRTARAELNSAIAAGDPVKIEQAKTKAIAAGIKFDKPNNEFTAVTDSMGMNITRTNKDTGAVDIIDGRSGALKASIAAPGSKPAVTQAPATAIDFLKQNPAQAAAFKAKYHYLPEGF